MALDRRRRLAPGRDQLVVGTAFVLHGWQKMGNPMHWMDQMPGAPPAFLQLAAVLAEVGGGAFLIAGLLTPLAVKADLIASLGELDESLS